MGTVGKADVIYDDGTTQTHAYWSTHCRHGHHEGVLLERVCT